MKSALPVFVCMLFASGCSALHQVNADQSDQWMADAQHNLLNRDATVMTTDGRALEGKIIRLNSDSLWVQLESDNTVTANRLDHVGSIRPARQVFPVVAGLLGGTIVGAVVGGSIGTSTEPPRAESLGFNTVASGLDGMLIGGLVGGVAGVVGLGLATAVDDYQFNRSQPHKIPFGSGQTMPDSLRRAK